MTVCGEGNIAFTVAARHALPALLAELRLHRAVEKSARRVEHPHARITRRVGARPRRPRRRDRRGGKAVTGCEMQRADYSMMAPRVVTCRGVPARMVHERRLGWDVAICEACYANLGSASARGMDVSRPWGEHPLQDPLKESDDAPWQ